MGFDGLVVLGPWHRGSVPHVRAMVALVLAMGIPLAACTSTARRRRTPEDPSTVVIDGTTPSALTVALIVEALLRADARPCRIQHHALAPNRESVPATSADADVSRIGDRVQWARIEATGTCRAARLRPSAVDDLRRLDVNTSTSTRGRRSADGSSFPVRAASNNLAAPSYRAVRRGASPGRTAPRPKEGRPARDSGWAFDPVATRSWRPAPSSRVPVGPTARSIALITPTAPPSTGPSRRRDTCTKSRSPSATPRPRRSAARHPAARMSQVCGSRAARERHDVAAGVTRPGGSRARAR